MKNLTKKLGLGIASSVLIVNTAYSLVSGLVNEKSGNYKTQKLENGCVIMTDGNKDGFLDRVDVYVNEKKKETIYRDTADKEIIKMVHNKEGYYILPENSFSEVAKEWRMWESKWAGEC